MCAERFAVGHAAVACCRLLEIPTRAARRGGKISPVALVDLYDAKTLEACGLFLIAVTGGVSGPRQKRRTQFICADRIVVVSRQRRTCLSMRTRGDIALAGRRLFEAD